MQTLGVFRFADPQFLRVSSVLALTLVLALATYYYKRYKSKRFTQKDALVVSLLASYGGLVSLSFLRLTPLSGLNPTSNPENYIVGSRYLFVYAIPLILALAIACGDKIIKISRPILYIFIGGVVAYGVVIQIGYRTIDPGISNRKRTDFYNLTPKALKEAQSKKLTIPNISSDLFWPGFEHKLTRAINIRNNSYEFRPVFKDSVAVTSQECYALRETQYVATWLNLYSQDWCKTKANPSKQTVP